MTASAYLFEIRQIQDYVFSTGKLRDASGASELIDGLASGDASGVAGKLIERVLGQAEIFRAAGGVLDMVHPDAGKLATFRAAFRLAAARAAPGLVYNDTLATAQDNTTARTKARNSMSSNGPAKGTRLPLGSPIIRPAPRSGASPAILHGWTKGGTCRITKEYADLATQRVRQHLTAGKSTLTAKFTPLDAPKTLKWPVLFRRDEDGKDSDGEVFPFAGSSIPRIAVLHADGNGMGRLYADAVMQLALEPEKIRQLSQELARATLESVQAAMKPVVQAAVDHVVPARPILLGGDDVSLLLRADLAVQFAVDFANAFGDLATRAVEQFLGAGTRKMSTKIGIVTIAPNQPFARAYDLAESLASAARHETESRIAFHRITTAAIPATAQELEEDGRAKDGFTLWRSAHTLGEIGSLRALARLLDNQDVARGGLRRVPELLKSAGRDEAHRVHDRALSMVNGRSPGTGNALTAALAAVGMPGNFFDTAGGPDPVWCPLLQAHDLWHIETKGN